jgi:hypothetical protein
VSEALFIQASSKKDGQPGLLQDLSANGTCAMVAASVTSLILKDKLIAWNSFITASGASVCRESMRSKD